MKTYNIKLNENQLAVLAEGLEFYSRFMAGQWTIPTHLQFKEFENQNRPEDFWENRNKAQDMLREAKVLFFKELPLHDYYGIHSSDLHEHSKVAYDIYRPILETIHKEMEKENPDNNYFYSVYSHPGATVSKSGRVKINKIK